MAELGYARGMYGWRREKRRSILEIFTPGRPTVIPLASGSSLKSVREALSVVPRHGGRRPLDPTWGGYLPAMNRAVQLDLEAVV